MEKLSKVKRERERERALKQKGVALAAGVILVSGSMFGLSGCDSNENNEQPSTPPVTSTETPGTAQGQSDGFVTPEDPGTPNAGVPGEETPGDNPEQNSEAWLYSKEHYAEWEMELQLSHYPNDKFIKIVLDDPENPGKGLVFFEAVDNPHHSTGGIYAVSYTYNLDLLDFRVWADDKYGN